MGPRYRVARASYRLGRAVLAAILDELECYATAQQKNGAAGAVFAELIRGFLGWIANLIVDVNCLCCLHDKTVGDTIVHLEYHNRAGILVR